jgi:hypothetical protein
MTRTRTRSCEWPIAGRRACSGMAWVKVSRSQSQSVAPNFLKYEKLRIRLRFASTRQGASVFARLRRDEPEASRRSAGLRPALSIRVTVGKAASVRGNAGFSHAVSRLQAGAPIKLNPTGSNQLATVTSENRAKTPVNSRKSRLIKPNRVKNGPHATGDA